MKSNLLIGICVFFISAAAHAEPMYVNNIIKITLRTGPGTDHKVLKMLNSGQELEIIEQGEDWTHVRLPNGIEGWILGRFISSEKPSDLLLKILEHKHEQLLKKSASLIEENKKLKTENTQLSNELESANKQLTETSTAYKSLQVGSSDYLNLKSKYDKTSSQLSEQTNRAQALYEQLLQTNIKLGLAGAGVLFFGFIVGYSIKKQRKRSSLLS